MPDMAGSIEYHSRQPSNKSKYMLFHQRQKMLKPLILAEAYLLIEGRPVTRAYQDEINAALSSPDLRDHMI
eukprot:4207873-Ditylum_brightwellii.AAC.1